MNTRDEKLTVEVRIGDLETFEHIKNKYSEELEKEFGKDFLWASYIKAGNAGKYINFNINDTKEWENYFKWAKDFSEKLYIYFYKYTKEVKEINKF